MFRKKAAQARTVQVSFGGNFCWAVHGLLVCVPHPGVALDGDDRDLREGVSVCLWWGQSLLSCSTNLTPILQHLSLPGTLVDYLAERRLPGATDGAGDDERERVGQWHTFL